MRFLKVELFAFYFPDLFSLNILVYFKYFSIEFTVLKTTRSKLNLLTLLKNVCQIFQSYIMTH